MGFPRSSAGKESACKAGDLGLIPGSGRFPGEGNGNLLQYSCLATEDEMAGWHHWLDGRESGWTPGVGDGQGGLACCNLWGRKESDMTERLIWSKSANNPSSVSASFQAAFHLYSLLLSRNPNSSCDLHKATLSQQETLLLCSQGWPM